MAGTRDKDIENKISVVIIEDHISMRKALRRILEAERIYSVEEFGGPKEAIEYLKKQPVDLIISDIFMPKGSGWDVLRYVRGRTMANDTPVVFVTGEATKDDIVYSIDKGVDGYLIKPFEAVELLAKLKTVLERIRNPSERVQKLRQAESLFLRGMHNEAVVLFRVLSAYEPQSPRIFVGLAQAEAALGKTELALQLLEEAILNSPMYFPAFAVAADLMIRLGRPVEGIEFLKKELDINGKQPHRRIFLADLLLAQSDTKGALEQMRLAVLDDPRDEEVLLKTAEIHFAAGEVEKSIHYFMKTRRKISHSLRALDGISRVCLSINNPTKAIHLFTDALRLNPSQKDVLMARARLFEKVGDLEKALGDIDTFLISEADNLDALLQKGRILGKLNLHQEAVGLWNEVLVLVPSPENHARLGLTYLKLSQFKDAVKHYELALASDLQNTKYLFNLAHAYESMAKWGEAAKYYGLVAAAALPGSAEATEANNRLRARQFAQGSQRNAVVPLQGPAFGKTKAG